MLSQTRFTGKFLRKQGRRCRLMLSYISTAMFTDTHAHLTFPELKADIAAVLQACRDAQVSRVISIACSPETHGEDLAFIAALAATSRDPLIYAAAGVHPDHFDDPEEQDIEAKIAVLRTDMEQLFEAYSDRLVAVGECGLDFYRGFHPEAQHALLRMQLDFAAERDLPVVIHVRDAWEDLFAILQDYPDARFLIHCFTGGRKEAERVLTWKNSMISLSGIVSFKNAADIQAAVPHIPLDRMFIETDSPFLAPVPHRGKSNQPAYVADVATAVSNLLGIPREELGKATSDNAIRFFRL